MSIDPFYVRAEKLFREMCREVEDERQSTASEAELMTKAFTRLADEIEVLRRACGSAQYEHTAPAIKPDDYQVRGLADWAYDVAKNLYWLNYEFGPYLRAAAVSRKNEEDQQFQGA